MKKLLTFFTACCLSVTVACSEKSAPNDDTGGKAPAAIETDDIAVQNLLRSMQLADSAVAAHFTGSGMAMARYYNPYTKVRSDEKGSIWMYTASIEAVNAILHALKAFNANGQAELYNAHFARYVALLAKLYDNADYYRGSFYLTSYTRSRESHQQWSVYAVNRSGGKNGANVEGKENVYDDQQWLVRELLESYKITGEKSYLDKAEYLTDYVLDGWDCTRSPNGEEVGGIPWGPAYATKHSCSNGPMVSPLVWLHELYKGKSDEVDHRYIDATDRKTRRTDREKKSDYYLDFAKKVYAWQKQYLLRSDGVYDDLRGGDNNKVNDVEVVDGQTYKKGAALGGSVGPAITYNSGAMLSGAVDLYRATQDNAYLADAKKLSDASFGYFAKRDATLSGYYTYDISGFRNWFNGVLMRAYAETYPVYNNVSVCLESFQSNLDYAYKNFFYKGFLPTNLLLGWSRSGNENNRVEGMFTFAFAAEYAVLARHEIEK
ncbi:MAG: glycoside hydrolase family 76 protein [Prevotellaceae bacterium]|jgi:predicted alpha-1,6-mannanase (GH76 family)|nr:glycoside hydrolase family 76 protein [Prevotellaceae bacterium]